MANSIRSLCSFAFEEHSLQRVFARVRAANQRSVRALQQVGFRQEGTLRCSFFKDGEVDDVIVLGLMNSELDSNRTKSLHN